MEPLKKEIFETGGFTFIIEIHADDSPDNPREWDNLGQMVCWHRHNKIGDDHDHGDTEEFLRYISRLHDGEGYDTMDELLEKARETNLVVPIFMYEHSGISLNTGGFLCPFDSGQVGWAWVGHKELAEEWPGIPLEKLIQKASDAIDGEVDTYSDYLNGNVYGYRIFLADALSEDDADDQDTGELEEFDSLWSLYGWEYALDEARKECKGQTECLRNGILKALDRNVILSEN